VAKPAFFGPFLKKVEKPISEVEKSLFHFFLDTILKNLVKIQNLKEFTSFIEPKISNKA
jgi:hypothetical protein